MKVWVTLSGKEVHPTKVLAEHSGNMECLVEGGSDDYQTRTHTHTHTPWYKSCLCYEIVISNLFLLPYLKNSGGRANILGSDNILL
jgi:hypothetical protein